jgi:hypothetical protein
MLSMHLPRGAVEMKMRAEGADVSILDLDPEGPSPNQPATIETAISVSSAAVPAAEAAVFKLKDDPQFAKVSDRIPLLALETVLTISILHLVSHSGVNSTSKC